MAEMVKLGPPGVEGLIWDEGGKTRIVQILISHQQDRINSIRFSYKSDGKHVLSDTFGVPTGLKFNTVVIDDPIEFLVSISGEYMDSRLVSIAFETNEKKYGPFGGTVDRVSIPATLEEFKYDFGPMCGNDQKCCFGGFHGTVLNGYVNSIGVYVKPLEPARFMTDDENYDRLHEDLPDY